MNILVGPTVLNGAVEDKKMYMESQEYMSGTSGSRSDRGKSQNVERIWSNVNSFR